MRKAPLSVLGRDATRLLANARRGVTALDPLFEGRLADQIQMLAAAAETKDVVQSARLAYDLACEAGTFGHKDISRVANWYHCVLKSDQAQLKRNEHGLFLDALHRIHSGEGLDAEAETLLKALRDHLLAEPGDRRRSCSRP